MEEKKRKKSKKKKNRSVQSEDVPEDAASSPSSEIPEVTLDREADAPPGAVITAEEGVPPNGPSLVLQESGLSPEDPPLLDVELRQIVQESRGAFNSEARNSSALCLLLDDIKNCHATSQANLDHLMEQLRGEVLQLKQAASLQRNKEVDLDGHIQRLREEVSHLKVMQEAERERKVAEDVEIQQLREEMVKLSEGSIKQLRMVEEMSDIIHQLLKRGQSPIPMDACQLAHDSTPSASEAGVMLRSEILEEQLNLPPFPHSSEAEVAAAEGSELDWAHALSQLNLVASAPMVDEPVAKNLEKVNGHHVLLDQLESHTHQIEGAQTESFEVEKIAYSASSADPLVLEKLRGPQARAVDSTYVEAQRIQAKPADEHGLSSNSTEFVTVDQLRERENNLHRDFTPETIHSDSPQPAHMQAIDLKPLSDAPITGAPIRLFKFVARYVSGADLVK